MDGGDQITPVLLFGRMLLELEFSPRANALNVGAGLGHVAVRQQFFHADSGIPATFTLVQEAAWSVVDFEGLRFLDFGCSGSRYQTEIGVR